jgi:hypothetical protein
MTKFDPLDVKRMIGSCCGTNENVVIDTIPWREGTVRGNRIASAAGRRAREYVNSYFFYIDGVMRAL